MCSVFVISTFSSLYVYSIGGIIKNYPELGLTENKKIDEINLFQKDDNIHIRYNEKVKKINKNFTNSDKYKVLVVGNSFGRDFVNILLLSSIKQKIEISYIDITKFKKLNADKNIVQKCKVADYIFIAEKEGNDASSFTEILNKDFNFTINPEKVWVVGTKDFGNSNGIFYNKLDAAQHDCRSIRTDMKKGVLRTNQILKEKYGTHYIDLIGYIIDENGKVPVFTNDCKFISQDTVHLTEYGALFFAQILDEKFLEIIY